MFNQVPVFEQESAELECGATSEKAARALNAIQRQQHGMPAERLVGNNWCAHESSVVVYLTICPLAPHSR